MNVITVIVYVSTAFAPMSDETLAALLADARTFNATHGVTGALLYHDGNFLQYLEGPREGVDAVYARIAASKRHHGIIELLHTTTDRRQFADWHMGFAHAPRDHLLRLAQARWQSTARLGSDAPATNQGVGLLLNYWGGLRHSL